MCTNQSPGDLQYETKILPGVGRPLDFKSERPLFKNALDCKGTDMPLTTLREFTMLRLMNEITEKPEWNKKIFSDETVTEWKDEVLSQRNIDMTDSMFTYCIAELRHKTAGFEKTGYITAYDGDVVKSDLVISGVLKDALRKAAAPLENVTNESQRDWRPNSDEKVLDLVDPSLLPVVYGKTRILRDGLVGLDDCVQRCGKGEQLELPHVENAATTKTARHYDGVMSPYSLKFQWLPCNVMFREGDKLEITSYINNLHPKIHRPLYGVIEQVLSHTIPLWSAALRHSRPSQQGGPSEPRQRITYGRVLYSWDDDMDNHSLMPDINPGEPIFDHLHRLHDWIFKHSKLIFPEPKGFQPPPDSAGNVRDLRDDFKESGLQVIVKLVNIHLTPEKPDYEGGIWNVEGQLNEHICASAIYSYDVDNVTDIRLAFRQKTSIEEARYISYEQKDPRLTWLEEIFGCEHDGPAVQEIGNVIAKEGRLITWPNTLQNKVLPFSLADRTKPGHRKILALYLVDPHTRIISSANVPCQRRDWWEAELDNTQREGGLFPRSLPAELVHDIVNTVSDFPLGMEEAKKLRLELMEERKKAVPYQNALFESESFSFHEHWVMSNVNHWS